MTIRPSHLAVLRLVADGHPYADIGRRLHLSERTVKHYMRDVRKQLDARNTVHAMTIAYRRGLLELQEDA